MTWLLRSSIAAALLFATAALVVAAPAPADSQARLVERSVLSNGLRVVFMRDEGAPSVTVALTYEVGDRTEATGERGYTRLLARLLAEGNTYLPLGELPRLLDSRGGRGGVVVEGDALHFWETVPSQEIGTALWIEGGRLRGLPPDSETLTVQNSPTLSGPWRPRPYDLAARKGAELLFGLRPLDRASLTRKWAVLRADLTALDTFHRRFLTPNNAVLTVVGNFDRRRVRQLIGRYLADVPRGPPLPPLYLGDPPGKAGRAVLRDTGDAPAAWFGYPLSRLGTSGAEPLAVAAHLLFSSQSGALHRSLVETGAALAVSGGISGHRGPRMVHVVVVLGTASVAEVESAVDRAVAELITSVTDAQVEAAAHAMAARATLKRRSHEEMVLALGSAALRSNMPSEVIGQVDRFLAVDKAQVVAAAQRYLDTRARVLVEVAEPEPEANP